MIRRAGPLLSCIVALACGSAAGGAGDGPLTPVPPRHSRKIGKLLPRVPGLQTIEIRRGRTESHEELTPMGQSGYEEAWR